MSKAKEEKIVRMTLKEAVERHNRGEESGTDWERVNALTDEDIEAAVRDDPDAAPIMSPEFWKDAILVKPGQKILIDIPVDFDVVDWFKSQGERYESQMNNILRTYMEAHKESTKIEAVESNNPE